MLETLVQTHPRLILTEERAEELRQLAQADTDLQNLLALVRKVADATVAVPPHDRILVGDKRYRMLQTSRAVLSRVLALGVTWRIFGEEVYKDRLRRELLKVTGYIDWHPEHFLDTAEMSAAVAVGYDWLYHELTDEERTTIRDGLLQNGLRAGLARKWHWLMSRNNWNQVCNGGLVLGALAIAEDAPEIATATLAQAKEFHLNGLEAYRPSGVYPEGSVYWVYGTFYTIFMLSGLVTALGDDWGIWEQPGFLESFDYWTQMVSPTNQYFNYADGRVNLSGMPQHMYLAYARQEPRYAKIALQALKYSSASRTTWVPDHAHGEDRGFPLMVPWFVSPTASGQLPRDYVSAAEGTVHVAAMRSRWDDENALYVGVKGGRLVANHGHLDAGSFVLDSDGVRWAEDLGQEREIYDRTDSWGLTQDAFRWTFFRANNFSHNTLTIGKTVQRVDGSAPIIKQHSSDERSFVILDLSAAYAHIAHKVQRGVMMLNRRQVLVQDEFEGIDPESDVCWTMMTQAGIDIQQGSNKAVLTLQGKELLVEILSPSNACFSVIDAKPSGPKENQNEGYQRLIIRLKPPVVDGTRLTVLSTPRSIEAAKSLDVQGFDMWE